MATAKLSINQVSKRFGGVVALNDVTFDVSPGSFHSICGENGAGKSTLMKILSGVLTDYEGSITLNGQPVQFATTRDAEAAGVAIIHQELNLVEELSAAANVFLGRERTGPLGLLKTKDMERAAGELFQKLECDINPAAPVSELRVGDQQLVEIAKALSLLGGWTTTATEPATETTISASGEPGAATENASRTADVSTANDQTEDSGVPHPVLIMDEPTSALTESETERLFRVIETLRAAGTTILYISHKMEEVFRLSDTVTVLRDGQHVRTCPRDEITPTEVIHLMVGREIENTALGGRKPGDVVLRVKSLSLPNPHASRDRLTNVSFDLRAGEVVGVAGLMGAGRTELLESIFGASETRPDGLIELDGRSVRFSGPHAAKNAGVAMVTEDRKRLGLLPHMTVRENITLSSLKDVATAGVVSGRYERTAATESIDALRIKTDGPEAGVMSLSGGNQQKCVIARWLRTNPRVLLLDDPTRGVDVGAKAELYKIIDDLSRNENLAVLVTSSELPELITLCDRILVLCEGRLTGEVQRENFTEAAIMELATTAA